MVQERAIAILLRRTGATANLLCVPRFASRLTTRHIFSSFAPNHSVTYA
jgi:hypothetical protein